MAMELVWEESEDYAAPGTLYAVHGGGTPVSAQPIPHQGALDAIIWTPCTAIDGNSLWADSSLLLLARNTGTVEHILIVYSAITPSAREDDREITIPPGGLAVITLREITSWRQGDGRVYCEGDSEEIELAVVRLGR